MTSPPPAPRSAREFAYGHLKLRHLQLLGLLHREGSITRAAHAMHLTQPAVSAMLRELESIFGIRMVERSRQGVTLTAGAFAALRRFSTAIAEVDAAHGEALLAERHARRRLRVGSLTLAMLDLVPAALGAFLAGPDAVQVELTEGTVDGLSGQLLRGELDIVVGRLGVAVSRSQDAVQFAQVDLFDEPRCVVARAGHPLAGKRSIGIGTLARSGWILQPAPSSTRLAFDELFLLRGLPPPVPVIESASVHSNLELLARTDLLALAPLALARRHVASGALQRLSCAAALPGMSIAAIWRRTSELDPLAMRFRDALVAASAGRTRRA
jgi:DNA-binding transcriptional LysR family regulator